MLILVNNPKAKYDYHLMESYCAGIVLKGSEVKALSLGQGSLKEAYVFFKNNELFLEQFTIPPYSFAGPLNHASDRIKKLLLNKHEIKQIINKKQQQSLSVIPSKVFFRNGKIKVEIWLAKPKKKFDKRETIKKKTIRRGLEAEYR
ncbi:SsrA-binding protein [Mycoplasmoides genitalium]